MPLLHPPLGMSAALYNIFEGLHMQDRLVIIESNRWQEHPEFFGTRVGFHVSAVEWM